MRFAVFFIQTDKPCAVVLEKQFNLAGGTVAVLGYNQFRQVGGGGVVLFVIIFPVEEEVSPEN